MADRASDPPPTRPTDTVKRVIKQGWLTKQGGASGGFFSRETWKRRWVTLDKTRLTWADNEKALPKGEVFIKDATIAEMPSGSSAGQRMQPPARSAQPARSSRA